MITTIGDLVDDVVVRATDPFHPGADAAARITRRRGGSASNVASVVAKRGGASRFVGQVGDDAAGRLLAADLAADGVEVVIRTSGRTGVVVVIVMPDGERSFFTDRGASVDLDGFDPRWLDGTDLLHLPAYSLAAPPLEATCRAALMTARDNGIPVTIDASSTSVISAMGTHRFLDLLTQVRAAAVFANRDEASLLGLGPGRPAPGTDATVVRNGGIETHVVLADGATTTFPVPPLADVEDTTGAGDAFAAGWLLATLAGGDIVEAIECAHHAAAEMISASRAEPAPDPR